MRKQIEDIIRNFLSNRQGGPSNQLDITPTSIKQRHIDGIIIFRGDVADRPTNGDTEVQAYFAEDENKLYIWNSTSEAWKSVTLS